jgi:hypothetical protein
MYLKVHILKVHIGLKTRSPPLFHSEFLHSNLFAVMILDIIPKTFSDISQRRPTGLLAWNLLPFKMAIITLSAVGGLTRFGLFVMNLAHRRTRVYILRLRKREQLLPRNVSDISQKCPVILLT